MKRLLFVSHSAQLTGMPQVLYNIASTLDRSRFEPVVLFPENGPIIERFKTADVSTAVIDIGDSRWGNLHIPMIEALCVAKEIDLVHANTLLSYPFVVASEKCDIPCVWYFQEMLGSNISFDLNESGFKTAVECASRIGTASQACKRDFLDYCRSLGLADRDVFVVHNGVRVPETFKLYEPKDPVQLLSIGNLAQHKGYHVLIDALALLNSSGTRVSSTILAGGPLSFFSVLWERAERAGVADHVHFLTAELDVARRIQEADIVVNPSRVENFSVAITEAMSHAKPVVATDVGGTRELLINDESGLLVPPDDAEALAKAVLKFIENSEFARQCGEKARERIAAEFPVEKQVEQLQDVYLSVLASSRPYPKRELSEHMTEIYALVSEALGCVSEKFHSIDIKNDIATNEIDLWLKDMNKRFGEVAVHLDGLKDRLEKMEISEGHLRNLEKDIRNLESAVNNILQQLPFRVYRKLKALLKGGRGQKPPVVE